MRKQRTIEKLSNEISNSITKEFKKSFKKLRWLRNNNFIKKLDIFIENQKHPSLRSKRIKGSSILYESSINMSIRVIWIYQGEYLIVMLDIGHHDILKRY